MAVNLYMVLEEPIRKFTGLMATHLEKITELEEKLKATLEGKIKTLKHNEFQQLQVSFGPNCL